MIDMVLSNPVPLAFVFVTIVIALKDAKPSLVPKPVPIRQKLRL
jgi:hypothetical protein